MNFYQRMGILPQKKRVNRDKCSYATKQRMFGVFAINEILRYRWTRFVGSRTLCHPVCNSCDISFMLLIWTCFGLSRFHFWSENLWFQLWSTATAVPSQWFWSNSSVPSHRVCKEYFKVLWQWQWQCQWKWWKQQHLFVIRWKQGRPLPAFDVRQVRSKLANN